MKDFVIWVVIAVVLGIATVSAFLGLLVVIALIMEGAAKW